MSRNQQVGKIKRSQRGTCFNFLFQVVFKSGEESIRPHPHTYGLSFQKVICTIQERNQEFFKEGEVSWTKVIQQTFHLQHMKRRPRKEKFWRFFSYILLKQHF